VAIARLQSPQSMVLNDSCMQPVIAAVVVFKKNHHQTVLKCLKIYLHTRISVNIKLFPCHIFLQNFSSPSSQTCDLVWRFDILQLHLSLGDDRVDHGLDSKPPSHQPITHPFLVVLGEEQSSNQLSTVALAN
jgi:hypothetical protein